MKNFIVQTFLPAFAAVLTCLDGQARAPINPPFNIQQPCASSRQALTRSIYRRAKK